MDAQTSEAVKVDWTHVAAFLRRVEGAVSHELMQNIQSQAFDGEIFFINLFKT